jgi:hypothetical protein
MRHIKEYDEHAMGQMTQRELDKEFFSELIGNPDLGRAQSLLNMGANVNARGSFGLKGWSSGFPGKQVGETALHFVAEYSPGLVEFLCDNGADIEALDPEGRTPLHHALEWAPCARILIERGARLESAFDSMDDLLEFFDGDISWIPDESLSGLKKAMHGKEMFGL